jgi:hypothetical protein
MHPFLIWATRRIQASEIEQGSGPQPSGVTLLKLAPAAARRFVLGVDGIPFIGMQPADHAGLIAISWRDVAITRSSIELHTEMAADYGRLTVSIPSTAVDKWMTVALQSSQVVLRLIELNAGKPLVRSQSASQTVPLRAAPGSLAV